MITLKEGDKAPVFKGTDQDGNKVTLTQFKAKKLPCIFTQKMTAPPVPYRPVTCATTIFYYNKTGLKLLV